MTSKRRLERRVAELEAPDDLPTVGIVTAFEALDLETKLVDAERSIYRIDGQLWHDRYGFIDGSGYINND